MELDQDLQSIHEVRLALKRAKQAQTELEAMNQAQIDAIVAEMAREGKLQAEALAKLAVEETGFGNVADKKAKNEFVAVDIYESIRSLKTVGIINRDEQLRVWEIAQPVGVIAGIVPSTNPTSTVMFKAMIALKSRNAIVISPHPGAKQCSYEAAVRMQAAAERAGAPSYAIQCLTLPTLESSTELMKHRDSNLILATGGKAMVTAAYSSGKPAYGVGPGNVPVYIHRSADLKQAVRLILQSKTFDYGTICASEQAIVVDQSIKQAFQEELTSQGAYMLSDSEKEQVARIIMPGGASGGLNPRIVGKSPQCIAEMAGFQVSGQVRVLIAEEREVGKAYPFSIEKLCPLLALYTVSDEEEGCKLCKRLLVLGGLGHTLGIHAEDMQTIESFGLAKPASRIVVNAGTTFGGIGMSTGLAPSLTLGCGSFGSNITSDNIGPQHLMNKKRVAFGIKEIPERKLGSTVEDEISRQLSSDAIGLAAAVSREEVLAIVKRVLAEYQQT